MRLHQNYDLYDITQSVDPGANYTVTVPMVSPDTTGQWGEAWALQQGSSNILCTFWVVIEVNRRISICSKNGLAGYVDPASSIFIQYFIQHLLTGKSIMEGLQIG